MKGICAIAILVPALLSSDSGIAHGGRTDTYGCHNQTATKTYHCHTGKHAGKSFTSKSEMLSTPSSTPAPAPPSTRTLSLTAPRTLPAHPMAGTPYNRNDYLPRWADEDGDCMNTRHEVLKAESLVVVTLSANGCQVVLGLWADPYTGKFFTNPSDIDIDHMVPLKEAHESGAAAWPIEKKRAYANDMANQLVLIAVEDNANQSKGDKDPSKWMPKNATYHCEYIRNWIAVKAAYALAMDAAEQRAISAMQC